MLEIITIADKESSLRMGGCDIGSLDGPSSLRHLQTWRGGFIARYNRLLICGHPDYADIAARGVESRGFSPDLSA